MPRLPHAERLEIGQQTELGRKRLELVAVDETVEERARRHDRADRVQPPDRDKGRVNATRQRQQALFEERAHTAARNC